MRLKLTGATLGVALGIGWMMETGSSAKVAAIVEVVPTSAAVVAMPAALTAGPVAHGSDMAPASMRGPLAPAPMGLVTPVGIDAAPPAPLALPGESAAAGCDTSLTAEPRIAAQVMLRLDAPCHAGRIATVSHGPLRFTLALDADGRASAEVPALSANPEFDVTVGGRSIAAARASVPEVFLYDRAVVVWGGDKGAFALHAREFGAPWGGSGHVGPAAPRAVSATLERDGYLSVLGDGAGAAPLHAQVYTYPAGTPRRAGTISLDVLAAVTEATCERDLTATALRLVAGEVEAPLALTVAMPDCTAAGGELLLRDLLEDLTIDA